MPLLVMKFGGTSLSEPEARRQAADHIQRELARGKQVLAVVSAMGRMGAPYATDTLLSLLGDGADAPTKDLLMSCGETVSACVFCDTLGQNGIPARVLTAQSAGLLSTDRFGNADLVRVDRERLLAVLAEGRVPVVTGFQGVTPDGWVTTLGRGGSDTSAVTIGAHLGAEAVDIYTDVDGIFRADPRVVPHAARVDSVSLIDMLVLARWGAGIIHHKALDAARELGLPLLRVRSCFGRGSGTRIFHGPPSPGFVGLAMLKNLTASPEGAIVCNSKRFASEPGGRLAVLTAVFNTDSEKERERVVDLLPGWEWEGNTLRRVVPREKAAEVACAAHDLLTERPLGIPDSGF